MLARCRLLRDLGDSFSLFSAVASMRCGCGVCVILRELCAVSGQINATAAAALIVDSPRFIDDVGLQLAIDVLA